MTPNEVLFVIRAAVQLGNAIDAALQQKLRDSELLVPDIFTATSSSRGEIDNLFRGELKSKVAPGSELEQYWDSVFGGAKDTDEARNALHDAALVYWSKRASSGTEIAAQTEAGLNTLKQWKDNEGPPPPFVRIVIGLAGIAADYAKTNPGVFRVGGRAEPIIAAIAEQISTLLPDADKPSDWPKEDAKWNFYYFAERTTSLFFQAGLQTIQAHPSYFAQKAHIKTLLSSTAEPLLKAFQTTNTPGQIDLLRLQEAIVGPAATAALNAIAEHQSEFLGDSLAPSRAAGAIVAASLQVFHEEGVGGILSIDGFQKLTSAALQTVVSRPGLFVGKDEAAQKELARGLLSKVAGAIKARVDAGDETVPRELLVEIGSVALNAVGKHAENFADMSKQWDEVASVSLQQVADGLADALASRGKAGLADLISSERAVSLARVVLEQAAKTTGMLTGEAVSGEVRQIVAAIAHAMPEDDASLLGESEWTAIAAVAAEEAARNPGRLFKLDGTKPQNQLAARLIVSILKSAASDFKAVGRIGGHVAAGAVLAEAVTHALRVASGDVAAAGKAVAADRVAALVKGLDDYARTHLDQVGWREWLWLYRGLLVDVIREGAAFKLTAERIEKLLAAKPATQSA